MGILKTEKGLAQLDKCPKCRYEVLQSDMEYENGRPVICRFCQDETLRKLHPPIGQYVAIEYHDRFRKSPEILIALRTIPGWVDIAGNVLKDRPPNLFVRRWWPLDDDHAIDLYPDAAEHRVEPTPPSAFEISAEEAEFVDEVPTT